MAGILQSSRALCRGMPIAGFRPGGDFVDQALDTGEEFDDRFDTVVTPGTAVGVGKAEAEIHAEGIRAVLVDIVIRGDRIAARLGHFLAVGAQDGSLVDQGLEGLVEIRGSPCRAGPW